jgi:hypothetical protein
VVLPLPYVRAVLLPMNESGDLKREIIEKCAFYRFPAWCGVKSLGKPLIKQADRKEKIPSKFKTSGGK